MNPERPDQMAASIDAIASRQMGVDPSAPPQGQAQGQAPQPPKDSQQDKAAEKGAPKTEGDKTQADPVVYSIDFGEGRKRDLTPQQIASTMERYAALNHKQAQYKPIHDLVEQIMSENPGMNAKQLSEQMSSIYKAQAKNAQMGNTEGDVSGDNTKGKQPQNAEDISAALTKWEEDNAVSLPPGYKEMMAGSGPQLAAMQQQMMQMQQMLQGVLGGAAGTADAAKQAFGQAQGQQQAAIQQQIANNIDKVQAALQIPDEAADDFMMYAAERGFTLEDFVDPQLTIKVMQDFRNNMQSPEMDRLRQIAQRRQAYTGSMGSSPAAPGGNEGGAPASAFDQMASKIMADKGLA